MRERNWCCFINNSIWHHESVCGESSLLLRRLPERDDINTWWWRAFIEQKPVLFTTSSTVPSSLFINAFSWIWDFVSASKLHETYTTRLWKRVFLPHPFYLYPFAFFRETFHPTIQSLYLSLSTSNPCCTEFKIGNLDVTQNWATASKCNKERHTLTLFDVSRCSRSTTVAHQDSHCSDTRVLLCSYSCPLSESWDHLIFFLNLRRSLGLAKTVSSSCPTFSSNALVMRLL